MNKFKKIVNKCLDWLDEQEKKEKEIISWNYKVGVNYRYEKDFTIVYDDANWYYILQDVSKKRHGKEIDFLYQWMMNYEYKLFYNWNGYRLK